MVVCYNQLFYTKLGKRFADFVILNIWPSLGLTYVTISLVNINSKRLYRSANPRNSAHVNLRCILNVIFIFKIPFSVFRQNGPILGRWK